MRKFTSAVALLALALGCAVPESAEESAEESGATVTGRWNVTVQGADGPYPTWFEIRETADGLEGSFVGRVGSQRPIEEISLEDGRLQFSLPVQYEQHPEDQRFEGTLEGDRLRGTTNAEDGSSLQWTAVRAPALPAPDPVQWGEPIELFNGQDLSGWKARHAGVDNNWAAVDGVLVNSGRGTDLITEQSFGDFRLQLEFMYPEGSNSGIYLRGQYEVQIQDDFGKEPDSLYLGGVYGFLTPTVNAAKEAGEWQSYDITLLGRHVTVVLNGETVIDNQEIPGITGGALRAEEDGRGPLMLQGDHGPVSFRNLVLTPAM